MQFLRYKIANETVGKIGQKNAGVAADASIFKNDYGLVWI